MADTTINVAPLINEVVIPIVVALAGVLATWLSTKLAALLGVKKDDALAARLEEAMKNGLAFAQSQLADKFDKGPIDIDVKNHLIASAADYASSHVPDTLKQLGIGPHELAEKLAARLQINTTPAELSVAVPIPPST